ncbi:MAG: TetR/AcrR family transcriptional regulator [Ruminococcus flavefaciens]|nr:TetR/AcrR family transcriptional regulator [Ruminococcus flavefaciens]
MPKGSPELTASRREEIINACEKLYQTMSFREITIKEIGSITSFTRTSIYNYFQTKEEIFLAFMQREYDLWIIDLQSIIDSNDTLSAESLAHNLACSLEKRKQLLKLLAMNLYDIEANSRFENLKDFKSSYKKALLAVGACLDKFCPHMSEKQKSDFIFVFFPFMFGVYPYTNATEKQSRAMREVGLDFVQYSIHDIVYNCVKNLLSGEY